MAGLLQGFVIALQPHNLFYCFVGVAMGTLVGVLPGLGPSVTIAMLLPVTFGLEPVSAIIMLSGICYGAMYGGSTTSILLKIPGEASSVLTCLDGYQMARKGRAGPALGISAFGSFIAGTFSVAGLTVVAPVLGDFALRFGPPEYFSLMIMAMTVVVYLSRKSMIKSLMMALAGLILGCVGMDPMTAEPRFTFGRMELGEGLGLVPVVVGLFGLSEVLRNLGSGSKLEVIPAKIKALFPNREDWKRSAGPIGRGTLLGFFLGILPGVGTIVPQFLSYALERRLSKRSEFFGSGEIEGVAGPEACNNAAMGGTFIPLFSLGIPSNAMTAMLLGALMVYGLRPGPTLINDSPDLFWGVIASMYVGNALLLVLNLPLIPFWASLIRVPYVYLSSFIVIFCLIGTYCLNNSVVDMYIAVLFGLIGLLMSKFGYEPAPLVLAFVLGPMIETALRRSLVLGDGNFTLFFERPLSAVFLAAAVLFLVLPLFKRRVSEGLGAED
ncbi:MAG: tripartite tricarboxylate transporter permease [Acidobacteria bacterium]|nr:tripartite tricarboxylate transporter permease [Acidobacteriota bacterium]